LLLNGASVVRWLQEANLVSGVEANVLRYDASNGPAELRVFQADADGVLVLGWNKPLAGALSTDGRLKLSTWLADALRAERPSGGDVESETPSREEGRMSSDIDLENGYVPEGAVLNGVLELQQVLSDWINTSNRPTVGDVGRFGGSPVLKVRMGTDEFVLNRDTKRTSVDAFLAAAAHAGGADRLRWHVTMNARGAVNRVTYQSDDGATPGWYAYVRGVTVPRDLA
jgi:hypothetical protein